MKIDSVRVFVLKHPFLKTMLYPVNWIRRKLIAQKAGVSGKDVFTNLRTLLYEDPVIKVDEFQGVFRVGVGSDILRRLVMDGVYEPELSGICLHYLDKDRDVIDIGANIGFFSVLFSKNMAHGKVLAIEPTHSALTRLKTNLVLNKVQENVVIYEGVVTDINGDKEIKVISGKEEYSSVGVMHHPSIVGENYTVNKVPSSTLDILVNHYSLDPGLIKIDVEGMEHLVLKGAENVLKNNRPIIISELSDPLLRKNGASSTAVIAQLKQFGYRIVDPIDPSVPPGHKEYGDIVCFPEELSGF